MQPRFRTRPRHPDLDLRLPPGGWMWRVRIETIIATPFTKMRDPQNGSAPADVPSRSVCSGTTSNASHPVPKDRIRGRRCATNSEQNGSQPGISGKKGDRGVTAGTRQMGADQSRSSCAEAVSAPRNPFSMRGTARLSRRKKRVRRKRRNGGGLTSKYVRFVLLPRQAHDLGTCGALVGDKKIIHRSGTARCLGTTTGRCTNGASGRLRHDTTRLIYFNRGPCGMNDLLLNRRRI